MKILYIARFNNLWNQEQIAQSFEYLGHKVVRVEDTTPIPEIIGDIEREMPDLVLWAKLSVRGDPTPIFKRLKELSIPSSSWTFDLYFGYYREEDIPHYNFLKADYVFTTDGGNDNNWKEKCINHKTVRQGIFHKEAFMEESKKDVDILFVGRENPYYSYRQKMLKAVSEKYDLMWIGRYNTNEIRGIKLNSLYGRSKIVIGDSVYSPHYWSNRLYETIGRGGFTIFPNIEGIEQEFENGKHFILYENGNIDDLLEKIEYYLKHDEEREKIRKQGFEFCKENYPYYKRCKQLLDHIYEYKTIKK